MAVTTVCWTKDIKTHQVCHLWIILTKIHFCSARAIHLFTITTCNSFRPTIPDFPDRTYNAHTKTFCSEMIFNRNILHNEYNLQFSHVDFQRIRNKIRGNDWRDVRDYLSRPRLPAKRFRFKLKCHPRRLLRGSIIPLCCSPRRLILCFLKLPELL